MTTETAAGKRSPAPGPVHIRRADEAPEAIIAAGVLLSTGYLAKRGVPRVEQAVFQRLNRLPAWLEVVLWAPMQMGSLFGPVIVGALAWWRFRRWRPTVGAVFTGVIAWQLAKVVKEHVDRGRPLNVLVEDVISRLGTPTDGLGFVSGHSAVAFALATVLSPYVSRPARWSLYAVAAVVSIARVHVAAHLPLDTVGGASLGCLLGWMWHLAVGVPDDVPGITGDR